jgi:hypothetical protein
MLRGVLSLTLLIALAVMLEWLGGDQRCTCVGVVASFRQRDPGAAAGAQDNTATKLAYEDRASGRSRL